MSSSTNNNNSDNAAIQSAVTFLRDPSVQSSTLARKVAFLEAKGLSSSDIDTAIRIASSSSSSSAQSNPPAQTRYAGPQGFQQAAYPDYRQHQQQQRERLGPTWKDWFIVATIGGAAGTLLYSLARKYLVPALSPPSSTELTSVQDALTAKYDEAASILAQLQQETADIKSTLQEECVKIDGSVEEIESALKVIKEKEQSRDEEFKNVKEDVEGLKALMERMFDKHKEAQTTSLNDIQQEVKSLKSLLVRRNVASDPSSSSAATNGTTSSTTSVLPAPTSLSASDSTPTATPSSSLPQAQASTSVYGRPQSPYAYGGPASRFGLGSSRSASSSSIADIANRPPGIPAWQLAASQPSTSAAQPASSSTAADASAVDDAKKENGGMEDSTPALNGSASEYEEVKKPEEEKDEGGSEAITA